MNPWRFSNCFDLYSVINILIVTNKKPDEEWIISLEDRSDRSRWDIGRWKCGTGQSWRPTTKGLVRTTPGCEWPATWQQQSTPSCPSAPSLCASPSWLPLPRGTCLRHRTSSSSSLPLSSVSLPGPPSTSASAPLPISGFPWPSSPLSPSPSSSAICQPSSSLLPLSSSLYLSWGVLFLFLPTILL